MRRSLLAAAVVFALPVAAFAQDASVLSGWDDIAFAKALCGYGQPEFAERLLFMVERSPEFTDQSRGPVTAMRLDIAQDRATKIEDPLDRKNALVQVLAVKEKFAADYDGSEAAEEVRNLLPDLYNEIGDALTAAIKKTTDEKALEALRAEGNAIFEKAEQAMKDRIAVLIGASDRTETDEIKLQNTRYNYPHTMYYHSLLFPAGSGKRTDLCKSAMAEYDEFLLDYEGGDPPVFLVFYVYIDYGNCLKETGAPDEATKMFDKTIALRESWGPPDEKTCVWPIPADFQDIIDLVGYATLQKAIVMRETKKPAEVVAVCKDYFASMPKASDSPYSRALARELADAQPAAGK